MTFYSTCEQKPKRKRKTIRGKMYVIDTFSVVEKTLTRRVMSNAVKMDEA